MASLFIPAEVIRLKRDGATLSDSQIKNFIDDYTSGKIPDYQMSAFLMAIYFKGLTEKETYAFTQAMINSGNVLDLTSISEFKVDKHSTGGVGDKTSMILAPLVAAAGCVVPMIAGRGLGHTGGTLDKLESIPGFNINLSLQQFEAQLKKLKLCFIGQTAQLAPADKKLYALRDVTATIESIPLICASIMSKKLAEGIDGLVLDVKVGSGAFMKTMERATELGTKLKSIGQQGGKKISVLITSMDQPLGKAVGNALEIQECVDVLKGRGPQDTKDLSLELAAHMCVMARKFHSLDEAKKQLQILLDEGAAYKKFEEMCVAQGGNLAKLPHAKNLVPVIAERDGYVSKMNVDELGMAALILGGGRLKTGDPVDAAVGVIVEKKLGDSVKLGDLLATMHVNDNTHQAAAKERILKAYEFSLQKVAPGPLIKSII